MDRAALVPKRNRGVSFCTLRGCSTSVTCLTGQTCPDPPDLPDASQRPARRPTNATR